MYGDQPINFTLISGTAIPRYHVVVATGTNYAAMATSKVGVLVGIAQNEPAANEHVTVCPTGRSRAIAGGAVSLGARVTTSTSGRVVAAASGDVILGYALEAAGADGDNIQVMVGALNDKMIA